MVSVFPALFDFSLLAVFVLRVTVSFFFLTFGLRLMRAAQTVPEKGTLVRSIGFAYGALKLLVGILLFVGMYTQVSAFLGMILSIITLSQHTNSSAGKSAQHVQLLLFIICLSLIFLGPGIFAVDIPL